MSGMRVVGLINQNIIDLLNLPETDIGKQIMYGESNEAHMKSRHFDDFNKYGSQIELIIAEPDYVYSDSSKNSVEFVKQFYDVNTCEHVLVAVRATGSGTFFARTLFVMSDEKVNSYKERGFLKPYK